MIRRLWWLLRGRCIACGGGIFHIVVGQDGFGWECGSCGATEMEYVEDR